MPNVTPTLDSSFAPAAQAISKLRATIDNAARSFGRDPASVTLIAASKTVTAEGIEPAIVAGHFVFGENRVQEAEGKWPDLCARHPQVELHLIGPLQTNKIRAALALFDVIHSVDRPSLAEGLAREAARLGKKPRLFVQVNIGAEPQKAGIDLSAVDVFVDRCRNGLGLDVIGLMCIPPVDVDPVPHFRTLARLARQHGLPNLSMGMSADFVDAIACGATHVRVGSAIFGARPTTLTSG